VKVWYRRKFRIGSNNIVVYFYRWECFSAYHSFVIRLSLFAFALAPDQSQWREAFGIFGFLLFCCEKLRTFIDFIWSCSIPPTTFSFRFCQSPGELGNFKATLQDVNG